jgi:hypothetical protein
VCHLKQHTTLPEALRIKHILIRVLGSGVPRSTHVPHRLSQLILKLTPILDLFGARRLSQQSHPFFPELRKDAYPVYTDTGAALFTEVRGRGILRTSLWGELVLYYRLGRLGRGYGVCVPMHYLPGALFGSKDHRDPKGERCNIFTSADLGLRPLYLHHVGKLRSYVPLYDLGANELAVSDLRCSMLPSLSNLIPSMGWRAIGISEADVFPMGS